MPRSGLSAGFEGPARRRAALALDDAVAAFRRAGLTRVERRDDPLTARVSAAGEDPPLRLRLVPVGRVFGGTYGLEVATAKPVLLATAGLTARGKGVVRMQGVVFRPRRGDAAGRALAARLAADRLLAERLSAVHFETIRIEPDGRPVIRHLGGSVVWILFPPLVRRIPLVDEQARATVEALRAFAAVTR